VQKFTAKHAHPARYLRNTKWNCYTQFEEQVEEGFAWQNRRPRAPLPGNLFVLIVRRKN